MRPLSLFLIAPLLGLPLALLASPLPRVQTVLRTNSAAKPAVVRRALTGELNHATPEPLKTACGAVFSSPLISSVPKANYRSVVVIANGKRVGEVSRNLTARTPQIKVYLVAFGDGGKIGRKFGCDDSLVPVTRPLTSIRSPLKFALQSLLSMPQQDAKKAGLENFWKGRNLRLKSVALQNGVATIHISGELFVAGVCDQPRITEQIEATARQFARVKQIRVFIEGQSLASAIS